jgi:hypothetical protein
VVEREGARVRLLRSTVSDPFLENWSSVISDR